MFVSACLIKKNKKDGWPILVEKKEIEKNKICENKKYIYLKNMIFDDSIIVVKHKSDEIIDEIFSLEEIKELLKSDLNFEDL